MYILKYTLAILTLMMPLSMAAQKITLGSVNTKDGGQYQGEIMMGKPHGKGRTVYKNGNTYEGQYEKGKRQGYGTYIFFDGEKYEGELGEDGWLWGTHCVACLAPPAGSVLYHLFMCHRGGSPVYTRLLALDMCGVCLINTLGEQGVGWRVGGLKDGS